MKKNHLLFFLGLVLLGIFSANSFIFAQTITIAFTDPITGGGDLDEMLERILSWLWPLSLIIGVLMLLIGAYYFIFSAGDTTKVATGRRVIVYALIGIAIITIATGIVALTREIVDPTLEPFELLINIIRHIFGFVALIAAVMVIISGYMFVTSGGDAERITRAKRTLKYALIGLAIAVLSRGIITLLAQILDADVSGIL